MWCFTLSTFLSNDWTFRLGQVMFEYNLYPIFSVIVGKTSYTLRATLLLSSSIDVSADTVDDEGSFEFSPKAEFTSPLYLRITLAMDTYNIVLRTTTTTSILPKHFETLSIQMLFKPCIA